MSARDCSLALTLLLKYQLGLYNFLRLRFQRVHQPHPAHGVTGFQFLGDARRLHYAGQHGVHPFTRRPVNPQQVRVQLFAQNQAAVKGGPVFLQIALLHTAILADGDLRLFRKFQVGGLIPAAGVSQFVSSGNQRDSIEFDPCIG